MLKRISLFLVVIAVAAVAGMAADTGKSGVTVTVNEAAQRVDVMIDGQPFTSYLWAGDMKKPVLFPIRTAKGTIVTRGYPLDARPGEDKDHPHHIGQWLNYGDVNGIDFWGNSSALSADRAKKTGSVVHRSITKTESGKDKGVLEVKADWIMPDGSTILREETQYIFRKAPDARVIDRVTTWTARDQKVLFGDTKEGMFAFRVARSLQHPQKGKQDEVSTGMYRSSEGKTGDDVWGTRGRWMILTGKVESEPVTVAIFDHPGNPGFPTYWHARGYGLFAANPFGHKDFTQGKEELKFTLEPKHSTTLRYRTWVVSGTATADQAEAEYKKFVQDVK